MSSTTMRPMSSVAVFFTAVTAVTAVIGAARPAQAATCYVAVVESAQQASNGSVTVSGAGCPDLGSRPDFNVAKHSWHSKRFLAFRFDDFEAGVPIGGSKAYNQNGFYSQFGGAPWVVADDALTLQPSGGPGVSPHFVRRIYTDRGPSSESGGLSVDVSGSNGTIYTTFKFLMAPSTQGGKIFRAWSNQPTYNFYVSAGCRSYAARGGSECTATECAEKKTHWGSEPKFTPGIWHRAEILASAGSVSVVIDGVTAWVAPNWLSRDVDFNGHTLDFPNMIDSPKRTSTLDGQSCNTTNGSYNFDDIYVDFTPVRLEIGDSPNWFSVVHREVQLVTAWQPQRIDFALNLGELSPSKPLFAYVVTSHGPLSAVGIPVSGFGGASREVAPPVPPKTELK